MPEQEAVPAQLENGSGEGGEARPRPRHSFSALAGRWFWMS